METTQAQSVGLLGLDHKLSLSPVVSHCPGVTWPQGRFCFLRVTRIFHKLEGRAKAAAVRLGWGRCEPRAGCPGETHLLCYLRPSLTLHLPSGPSGGECVGPSQVGQQHRLGWTSTN